MAAILRPPRRALGHRLERWVRPRQPEPLPTLIDRRRVYVLPSGFGLFLAVLLGGMLLGALNYNNNPALLLAFLIAAAAHNSLVRAHLILSGVRLMAASAEPVHVGAALQLSCRFDTAAMRERRGLVLRQGAESTVLSFDAEGHATAQLSANTTRRGWHDVGRLRLSTRQPHGFAEAWCWFWPDTRVLVYPQLETNPPPLPHDGGDGSLTRRRDLAEELHHLRDYRSGDPMRHVAWKASARADRLLVREHEGSAGREVHLDWGLLAALDREARIRRLARWVVEAERAGLSYRLTLPDLMLGPARGADHRHACLRALALMPHG